MALPAQAAYNSENISEQATLNTTKPTSLEELQNLKPPAGALLSKKPKKPDPKAQEMRENAMRESALSFGARGALGARTWQIRQELLLKAGYLDRVFDFRSLLIATGSGLLI
ncbi:MAG: hypothetical protein EBV03_12380, partial [Proteobacteria bacterium]|nr:hypothetical protein [Pseudomonadota bacterium]